MAPSHVPSEHLPLQGQSIYADPTYTNLFPQAGDQFVAQSWNSGQLNSLASPDQSWHHNTYLQQQQPQSYSSISQSYQNQGQALRPASPYQYGQFGNHASISNYAHAANVDPALTDNLRQQQHSPYAVGIRNARPQAQSSTVTPQALQQVLADQNPRPLASPYQNPKTTAEIFAAQRTPSYTKPPKNPEYELPKGKKSGAFVILDQSAMVKATKSNVLNKFVTFGSEPLYLPSNRTALPLYTPRQSVKDLRKAGADNKKLLAKKLPAAKLPSGRTIQDDASDSESYDDSSEDGDDTDDEDDEPSPLPASRPEGTQDATRYDIIKATWYPRNKQPSSEKIKASLRDFWELVNTIQKRWRLDSKAVTEAEEKKQVSELPELRKRVTGQRALLHIALRSVLEYGHPDVLYHFGQVTPFFYLCYQFLANRFKMQDYDGELPSVIYEVLVRCIGTLSSELLEETKVIKALNLMKKKANEKHQILIQKIIEGAIAGSKKIKANSPPVIEVTGETKSAKRPTPQPSVRPLVSTPVAKKLKATESIANGDKKPATGTAALKPATTATSQLKRPGEKVTLAPAKARGTQIVNKPSNLFASFSAASKKPTTIPATSAKLTAKAAAPVGKEKKSTPAASSKPSFSFAETMAELMKPKVEEPVAPTKTEKKLPPETPEEKAKRLRKESRRHLRVKFRPDASLVAIQYFHHDPEEESGHDENQVRDAGDIGGEGRMFKQHKEMMDEDDDEPEVEYRPWTGPSEIDFSTVDIEERKRNYAPFGGGQCSPSCPEREANIQHERITLLLHYAHPSDIPFSPREPLESQMSPSASATVTNFGPPPKLVMDRAPPSTPVPTPDVLELLKNLNAMQPAAPQTTLDQSMHTPNPATAGPIPASAAPAMPDLSAILSAIGQPQGQATMPSTTAFPSSQQAPAAAPAVDLQAIQSVLANLGMANNTLPQANGFPQGPLPGFPPLPPGFLMPGFAPPQQDGGAAYQASTQSQHNQHSRPGHKRQRDDGNDNDRSWDTNKKGKFQKRHKTIPCRFFQIGKCNKGDDCTYIHDLNM